MSGSFNSDDAVDIASMSLARLSETPLDTLALGILDACREDLNAAVSGGSAGWGSSLTVDPLRVAWAISFNLSGAYAVAPVETVETPTRGTDETRRARTRKTYRDKWKPDTPFREFWHALTRERSSRADSRYTLLEQLTLSVACEQRVDWHPPGVPPVDAERAWEYVYTRCNPEVLGYVAGRFGNRAGDPDSIVAEAWSRVFADSWSTKASRRFLGMSRVSTFVGGVATYIALDILGAQRAHEVYDENPDATDSSPSTAGRTLGVEDDPARGLMDDQMRRHVRQCLAAASKRQRMAAELVWFREFTNAQAAEVLDVSRPRMTQLLQRAGEIVRNCLQRRGTRTAEAEP